MRIARKLLLLALTATAAMALAASTASATISVNAEPGGACPAVSNVSHVVTGGCHVNFISEGGVSLNAHIPGLGEILQSRCTLDVEARFGPDGEGWVNRATLNTLDPGCARRTCDELPMTFRPWRVHIRETAAATEQIRITFCRRTIPQGEGAAGQLCTLNLPFTATATHRYRITASPAQRCAEIPVLSLTGDFSTQGPEHIEVIHPHL